MSNKAHDGSHQTLNPTPALVPGLGKPQHLCTSERHGSLTAKGAFQQESDFFLSMARARAFFILVDDGACESTVTNKCGVSPIHMMHACSGLQCRSNNNVGTSLSLPHRGGALAGQVSISSSLLLLEMFPLILTAP